MVPVFGSTAQPRDTTAWKKFIPTAVRVGVDVVPFVRSLSESSIQGYEWMADATVGNFLVVTELGKGIRRWEDYKSSGSFFRIGIDANFLQKDKDKNVFAFGLRYSHARFDETYLAPINDPVFGNGVIQLSNTGAKADWLELGLTLKVKMIGNFWMGYTARYKVTLGVADSGGLKSAHIPGYGSTAKESTWGFSYYLMYRIPLSRKSG